MTWLPDVLGEGFEQLTLDLGTDDEGAVVATLVRSLPKRSRWIHKGPLHDVDVLYVHGWSDYFFNKELAHYWTAQGARFFALDLRKYGRSLRPGQTPGFIDDLETYDIDIATALAQIQSSARGHRRLFLLGHSTGGLILTLWAARHPDLAHALILNSPWLETQGSTLARTIATPIVKAQSLANPRTSLVSPDLGYYTRTISDQREGEWAVNLEWRPEKGFPAKSAWLAAILAGHTLVASGLSLPIPVLTLLSMRSTISPVWREEMRSSDIVLFVDEVARAALKIGDTVTVARIDGALHDVFLSAPPVRELAYTQVTRWLEGYRL